MTANTVTEHRALELDTIAALEREVDRLVAAQHSGHLVAGGNWTAAQAFDHLARLVEFSYEGFPFRASLPVRAFCQLGRRLAWQRYVRWVFQPGRRLPARAEPLLPDDWADFDVAVARYRAALERIALGEPMTARSPWEGALSHRQWIDVHLRHAELHLGFLDVTGR